MVLLAMPSTEGVERTLPVPTGVWKVTVCGPTGYATDWESRENPSGADWCLESYSNITGGTGEGWSQRGRGRHARNEGRAQGIKAELIRQ